MLKPLAFAAMALSMATLPASADISERFGRATKIKVGKPTAMPPEGFQGQWWTSPDNCEYSRSGRPGEIVWFLIINRAHSKCEPMIVQRGFKDAY